MKKSYTPYTYLIGWSQLNKWYYGVETKSVKKIAHPSNLWTTYFTSSKTVAQMRIEHGEPDVIEVRQTFSCPQKAFEWEQRVLKKMEIWRHNHWINQAIQDGPYPTQQKFIEKRIETRRKKHPHWHTEETKKKLSQSKIGKPLSLSEEERKRRSEAISYKNKHDHNMIRNQRAQLVRRWSEPGAREKQKQVARNRFLNPEALEKKKIAQSTPQHKSLKRAIGQKQWNDKSNQMQSGFQKYFSDPEMMALHRERTIMMHQKRRGWDYIMVDGIKFRTIDECATHLNRCLKWVRKQIKNGLISTHLESHPS